MSLQLRLTPDAGLSVGCGSSRLAWLDSSSQGRSDNGAYDGAYARPLLSDDGVPLEAHRAFTTLLRNIFEIGQSDLSSPGH